MNDETVRPREPARPGARMSAPLGPADVPVLISEPIADAGVELLRERFAVDVGIGWSKEELAERIGLYDALVVRSATKVTAELIERGGAPAGDRPGRHRGRQRRRGAATRRGIVVCNAPESNSLSAAEHAVALMLAQARNIPQAHASLVDGRWERSRYGGIEVTGKTLGILGFGRIGQLVAERARGLGMRVVAYDPFVGRGPLPRARGRGGRTPETVYRESDFITLHLASPPRPAASSGARPSPP